MKKTVADLIEILRGLPQDALVVSDAGGDCIGYSDVVSDHATVSWKTGEILLSLADGSSSYHGAYDEWEDVLKSARKAAPASATDDEAIQLLAETAAQELAKAEEEALCIVKLPTGYNPDRWTIERYREREFRLSQRRAFVAFLRVGRPIRAIVLR